MPVRGGDRHTLAPTPGRSSALSSRHKQAAALALLCLQDHHRCFYTVPSCRGTAPSPVSQEGTGEGWKRWWLEEGWAEGWLCHSGIQTSASTLSREPEQSGPRLPWSPEEIRVGCSVFPAGVAGLRRTPVRNGIPHPLQALSESFLQHEVWRH